MPLKLVKPARRQQLDSDLDCELDSDSAAHMTPINVMRVEWAAAAAARKDGQDSDLIQVQLLVGELSIHPCIHQQPREG